MRYFVPELMLGDLLPPQNAVQDKFGGLPWGLPPEKWPLCAECGNPLSHLATLLHDAERLDLAASGRVMLVFQCNNPDTGCETARAESGANAVIFVNRNELSNCLASAPQPGAVSEIEARVLSWSAREDLVTPAQVPLFYDGIGHDNLWENENTKTIMQSVYCGHKVGSVPAWLQWVEGMTDPSYCFVAQLSDFYAFHGPVPSADQVRAALSYFDEKTRVWTERPSARPDPNIRGRLLISEFTEMRGDGCFIAEAANFGRDGLGYIFISTADADYPKGKFTWQCN